MPLRISMLTIATLLLFTFSSNCSANQEISISTGSTKGIYFKIGSESCYIVNNSTETPINCEVISSLGSESNINNLITGTTELSIAQADMSYKAWHGLPPFEDKHQELRILFALHQEQVTLFVHRNSDIHSLGDLIGKTIFLGQEGSGTRKTVEEIFQACSINATSYTTANIQSSQSITNVRNGNVDAVFMVIGHPSSQFFDTNDLRFIPLNTACVDTLVANKPYYSLAHIPTDTTDSHRIKIQTIGIQALLLTTQTLQEDLVDTLHEQLTSGFPQLQQHIPALLSQKKLDAQFPIPYHSGVHKKTPSRKIKPSQTRVASSLEALLREQSTRIENFFNFWEVSHETNQHDQRPQQLTKDQINIARIRILRLCPSDSKCLRFSQNIISILESKDNLLRNIRSKIRQAFKQLAHEIELENQTQHRKHQKIIIIISAIALILAIILLALALWIIKKNKAAYIELKAHTEKIERKNEIESLIGDLLHTSFSKTTLKRQLHKALELILSLNWGMDKDKGSIFIFSESTNTLNMAVQIGLPEILREKCKALPLGRCLCGKAGEEKKIIFADCIDERHEVSFDGIQPHGHYCVPILSTGKLIGVLNLYVKHEHITSPEEQNSLKTIAQILAELIERKTAEINREITEKELERSARELEQSAITDTLTELPNRRKFYILATQAIAEAKRSKSKIAILFLDLDKFKQINDNIGHEAGDHVLREFAIKLQECLRDSDIVARLGGDEFIILLRAINDPSIINTIIEKINQALLPACRFNSHNIRIATSIGVSIFPDDGDNYDLVVSNADKAMYEAKKARTNKRGQHSDQIPQACFSFYDVAMREKEAQKKSLKKDLLSAISQQQFRVFYQPIINTKGVIVGAEALIRWQKPSVGLVPPVEWIPFAESTGLIIQIGTLILEETCRQIKEWKQKNHKKISIAVNISGRQLEEDNFTKTVTDPILKHGLEPDELKIEITESTPLTVNSVGKLRRLSQNNIAIAMDDFGTGFSNLAGLRWQIYNFLKIDRAFVEPLPDEAHFPASLIGLAHPSGIQVTAEGIEKVEQLHTLQGLNCDQYQGYLMSRPLPAEEFEKLLALSNEELPWWHYFNPPKQKKKKQKK